MHIYTHTHTTHIYTHTHTHKAQSTKHKAHTHTKHKAHTNTLYTHTHTNTHTHTIKHTHTHNTHTHTHTHTHARGVVASPVLPCQDQLCVARWCSLRGADGIEIKSKLAHFCQGPDRESGTCDVVDAFGQISFRIESRAFELIGEKGLPHFPSMAFAIDENLHAFNFRA